MTSTVFLDIGGTPFRTSKSTLLKIPYFAAADLVDGIPNSKEEPYFIDRNPIHFCHILNWARNSDTINNLSYQTTMEIEDDLLFYGIAEATVEDEPETSEITEDPQHAMFYRNNPTLENHIDNNRSIQSHYFFDDELPLNTALYEQKNNTPMWVRNLNITWETSYLFLSNGPTVLPKAFDLWTEPYLQIPINIPLKDITVQFSINYCSKNQYRLNAIPFISPHPVLHVDNHQIIPLPFTNGHWPYMPVLGNTDISINIDKPKHPNVDIVLRYRGGILNKSHDNELRNQKRTVIYEHVTSVDFENTTTVYIPNPLNVRYMIWQTDRKIGWIKITNDDGNYESRVVDRVDFQFLERQRVGFDPLPNTWGSIYFCRQPHQYNVNSGMQLFSFGTRIHFPVPVSGTIWLVHNEVVTIMNNMMGYRYTY